MRTKMDFYRCFFEQLARRGFDVKRSTSSDYLADIYYKNQLIAFYTKADMIERNPFVSVKEKVFNLLEETAKKTAVEAGICTECPYTEKDEKLKTVHISWLNITGRFSLCCITCLCIFNLSHGPESEQPLQRQFFYNKESATQDLPSVPVW